MDIIQAEEIMTSYYIILRTHPTYFIIDINNSYC